MQKWKRMFWPTDDECTAKIRGTTGSVNTLVTVRDMQGSFFILFIGMCLYHKLHHKLTYYEYNRLLFGYGYNVY